MTKLSQLNCGESGVILQILGDQKTKQRLLQLGFTSGQIVKILAVSSLKKSFLISVRSYTLAIRKSNLDCVEVKRL